MFKDIARKICFQTKQKYSNQIMDAIPLWIGFTFSIRKECLEAQNPM